MISLFERFWAVTILWWNVSRLAHESKCPWRNFKEIKKVILKAFNVLFNNIIINYRKIFSYSCTLFYVISLLKYCVSLLWLVFKVSFTLSYRFKYCVFHDNSKKGSLIFFFLINEILLIRFNFDLSWIIWGKLKNRDLSIQERILSSTLKIKW